MRAALSDPDAALLAFSSRVYPEVKWDIMIKRSVLRKSLSWRSI